ncbi:GntR family transcriptional regulator [Peptoniphilus sp. KCTC 25270]|uniref:GntR family transcriptional regulator n=1 Tax=Peptoniphilus sp. KCTC 25270 TaxID=2897414 RepID=UPI001E2A978D|nr:GntR family transcriptional regulator [Peptoniphilus sp. KCTC 25270]MCD1147376.1 GntR family transcriptional regulator [Peptoniphilus sp. KCTC 25270]
MEFLSLKDHVYNFIADQIRLGKLDSNEKVNEQDICQQLNISRTPVREALIQLAADGFLESAPRRGFRVKPMTQEEGENIYAVLAHLDGLAVELAMDNLTEEDYKNMDDLVDLMDFHIDHFQFNEYYTLQEKFHYTYLKKSHNDTLINTISRLQRRFIRQGYGFGEDEEMRKMLKDTNQQHREIVRMFKEKKFEELEEFTVKEHWAFRYHDLGNKAK